MVAPDAIIIREEVTAGPTRRYVYHALAAGGYERQTQLWREAADGWHTTGTEVIECLAIDGVEGRC
jgi:hypothetical protein